MKRFLMVTVMACAGFALAGCTVQNLPNGGVAFNPVPMNKLLGNSFGNYGQGSGSGLPAVGQSMNYAGQMDGGNGHMTLANLGNGSYRVNMDVTGPQGMGSVSGMAYQHSDGSIWMDRGDIAPGKTETCVISFTPKNGGISSFERNCMFFHGASVSFDGMLYPN